MSNRRGSVPVFTVDQICHLNNLTGPESKSKTVVALIYVHASWTSFPSPQHPLNHTVLKSLLQGDDDDVVNLVGSFSLDQSDDAMACAVGDDDYTLAHDNDSLPIPPAQLPVLALSVQEPTRGHSRVRYITDISPFELMRYIRHHNNAQSAGMRSSWSKIIQKTLNQVQIGATESTSKPEATTAAATTAAATTTTTCNGKKRALIVEDGESALRIFIAGDRSSVGKSSVCLGLLGSLVSKYGYAPSDLAYIKPATQCEARQLVQDYCESVGIECVAVGPLVYYKGFTRAFLEGKTQSSQDLLKACGQAVDNIARGKKIVLVDGVGFPAVGSICGTDNASVSKACGYPAGTAQNRHPMGVVLVGGSGVGAAVDSFNLNSTYFEKGNVPVLGAIFNKLSTEGYYSLENCRTQLTRYFRQNEYQRKLGRLPFGFVPLHEGIAGENALSAVDDFVKDFEEHVDIHGILVGAKRVKEGAPTDGTTTAMEIDSPPTATTIPKTSAPPKKRFRPTAISMRLSRKDVEQLAASQGATTA